ncbi:MAG: FAD-dependent oxidoreductase [bacterium]
MTPSRPSSTPTASTGTWCGGRNRYDKGDGADYANAPLSAEDYAFIEAVAAGRKVVPRAFEEAKYFEGCLPIEVMVERGPKTLAFGPLKPVGLTDPARVAGPTPSCSCAWRTRRAAWNRKVGFRPGSSTRNREADLPHDPGAGARRVSPVRQRASATYLHAPTLLCDALLARRLDLYFAGRITGVEGYVESTACRQLIAWHVLARLQGVEAPRAGGHHRLRRAAAPPAGGRDAGGYSPSNLNWSLFAEIDRRKGEGKGDKRARLAERAQADLAAWWAEAAPRLGE